MSKDFIIHKTEIEPKDIDEEPESLCGSYSIFKTISASTNWRDVTCKRCLKQKGK